MLRSIIVYKNPNTKRLDKIMMPIRYRMKRFVIEFFCVLCLVNTPCSFLFSFFVFYCFLCFIIFHILSFSVFCRFLCFLLPAQLIKLFRNRSKCLLKSLLLKKIMCYFFLDHLHCFDIASACRYCRNFTFCEKILPMLWRIV